MSKQHAARPNLTQAELQRQATQVRSGGTRYIFARTGMKSRRRHRLSSNLGGRFNEPCAKPTPASSGAKGKTAS